jgi:hypothetical protein
MSGGTTRGDAIAEITDFPAVVWTDPVGNSAGAHCSPSSPRRAHSRALPSTTLPACSDHGSGRVVDDARALFANAANRSLRQEEGASFRRLSPTVGGVSQRPQWRDPADQEFVCYDPLLGPRFTGGSRVSQRSPTGRGVAMKLNGGPSRNPLVRPLTCPDAMCSA